ncbi:Methylamine utilisation protein MauE [Micromonospora echinaurantiaca]|uniref:Methylamine utilisation protein MauE n=1 Tax=Micromonospora echinaurantiaca TaxID=47857 RepID=A0A1C5HG06_9ACTN|nr:MauE/DoxX family redox-associated membrane protein [Micromonospora echinaurantiaca]SCG44914.1 Methylamine utilisation protein MauE [Micromonospora echinaurantiaca]
MSYLFVFSRCLLALVFLASAASKLRGRRAFGAFADSLRAMDLLPARLVVPVAGAVTVAEAAVPLLLVPLPAAAVATAGFAVATALSAAFTVAVAVVLHRGVAVSCRCFGEAAAAPFGRRHLVRNVVLTVAAGIGAYASLGDPGVTVGTAVLAVPLGLVGALVVVRLDDLAALFLPVAAPPGAADRGASRRGGRTSS